MEEKGVRDDFQYFGEIEIAIQWYNKMLYNIYQPDQGIHYNSFQSIQ